MAKKIGEPENVKTIPGNGSVDEPNKGTEPIEIAKRGRGRPRKEDMDMSKYPFKAGIFLASLGIGEVEVINRAVDNSKAVSTLTVTTNKGEELALLMWEREGQIAIFADAKYSDRKPKALLEMLAEFDVAGL